jgi:hypothetical protein
MLHVLPDPFVRIEIRGIGWQEEQLNPVLVLVDPIPGLFRSVVSDAVYDQEILPLMSWVKRPRYSVKSAESIAPS